MKYSPIIICYIDYFDENAYPLMDRLQDAILGKCIRNHSINKQFI